MMITEIESWETRELIERAMKLSLTARESLARELIATLDDTSENFEREKRAFREELARRVEAVRNGTMKTYTIEETMDHLRKALRESRSKSSSAGANE